MRVLHITKTADGAGWAAAQAAELVKLGVEVHVALPRAYGRAVPKWTEGGAILHVTPTDMPARRPWLFPEASKRLRGLVDSVRPDLIHSHFFGSTMLLRLALGNTRAIPRLYQVPVPQHLEHRFWRGIDLATAGPSDYWIASSRCTVAHYRAAGIAEERVYLSYYGVPTDTAPAAPAGLLRERYQIADNMKIVGNANFIYPPRWYLGERVGPKAHEDVIDALGIVVRQRRDVMGVVIGGTISGNPAYERRLRARARAAGHGRIVMTGYVPPVDIRQMWADFDVAIHTPLSENCGGVGEALLAGVPVIAGCVGGLPEVVVDGFTGTLVGIRDPQALARAVLTVLDEPTHHIRLAQAGRSLVRTMFDVQRTGREIFTIYEHVLGIRRMRPQEFDSLVICANVPTMHLLKPQNSGSSDLVPVTQLRVCVALFLLAVCAPVALVLALLIAFNTRRSPIFGQQRVGQHDRIFKIYKFRTLNSTTRTVICCLTSSGGPHWTLLAQYQP